MDREDLYELVMNVERVTAAQKALMAIICLKADEYPTIPELVRWTSTSQPTVSRGLSKLVELDVITIDKGFNQRNFYTFTDRFKKEGTIKDMVVS